MATYIYNRQRLLGQGCSTCETTEDRYLTFQYPSPADPGVREAVFFDDRTDGVTITLETIEPWAGCPDGDAGVIRASGPVPRRRWNGERGHRTLLEPATHEPMWSEHYLIPSVSSAYCFIRR